MNLFPGFPDNIEELATEYQRLWPLMPVLHSRIARLAGKDAIKACAKRLGLLSKQGGRTGIAFTHDLEAEIFQDYLLYMHRPRGFSLVRQFFNRKPYPPGSDEHQLLSGMVQARFSAFWIRGVHPAGAFVALDVITGKEHVVLDRALTGQEAAIGLLSAFRVFPLKNVWMHTGANMSFGRIEDAGDLRPLGRVLNEQQEQELNEENIRRWRALLKEMA